MKKIIVIIVIIFLSIISCLYAEYYEDPNNINPDTEITDYQVKKVAFILITTLILTGFGFSKVIDFWCILFLLATLGIIFDFEDLELAGVILIGMMIVCYQAIRDFIQGDKKE